MSCNCNHKEDNDKDVRRCIHGNVLRLFIPLTQVTITFDGDKVTKSKANFYPSTDYPVDVELCSSPRKYNFTATLRDGYLACIEDKGTLPVGMYDITVLCKDGEGNPYRYKKKNCLRVVDTTAEAGAEAGVEFYGEEVYLDAAVFFAVNDSTGGAQVQSDWEETDSTKLSYIRNKPSIPQQQEADNEMSDDSTNAVQNMVVKAYIDRVSQRIDTLVGSGNVQGAIDTFNEVVAFLDNIAASDTLAAVLAQMNADISAKANSADVANIYATKNELAGKQDALNFDEEPTENSANPVLSGGVFLALARLQMALDAITGEDTTHAIETFQEVINFLDGVTDDATLVGKLNELRTLINGKYEKPANGIPLSDLVQSVQNTLNNVANKVDKVLGKGLSTNDYTTEDKTKLANLPTNPVQSITVNGQTPAATPDTNGNVNVVVPTVVLDDAPTTGSDNGVKSGGVKQAIDEKLSNVTVNAIPAGSVAIVDDVVTDDPEQVLSARQGKRLADSIAGLGLEAHQANGTLFISRVADNRSVPPVITVNETSTAVTVTATGSGTITLYRGGTAAGDVVSNPLTINKTSTASVVRFYATAQQSGKTVSEMASLAVTIAAYVAPNPRLTSPAGGSSVNLTRTATQTPTSLSAQSGSPVTIPSGVASQQVAVTVNPPSDTLAFNNLLSKTVTFPYSISGTFSPWGTWKGSSGYTSSSKIILMVKITEQEGKGGQMAGLRGKLYIDGTNCGSVTSANLSDGTYWVAWQVDGWATNISQWGYFNSEATIIACYAVNFDDIKIGDDDTIDAAVQRLTNADIQLTPNDASYSNAGAQSLTITHNGTDTVVSNVATGNTITVEAGDIVSISSGSVSFSVDVTTHTAGTATVVVKGADLSQPISVAVSGTGFTCDTLSVTAADANSTNGKIVVVTYDASGGNTGALTLTSSEFNTVSVTLNGTNA